MTTASLSSAKQGPTLSWCSATRHCIAAAVILFVSAIGWGVAVRALKWATVKVPVPWPESVEVDADTFQNVSFPTKIGPYSRAEDGELNFKDGKPVLDGAADGESIIDETVMEPLGIGSYLDKQRVVDRRSNWYVSRVYIDRRSDAEFKWWRFSIYYYTGKHDMVPHVGEECLVAGGATITKSSAWTYSATENAPDGWKQVPLRRTQFAKDGNTYLQYYVFNSNGVPMNDRLAVRAQLALPTMKHCFFAKIEFAPLGAITDVAKADAAAREFLTHFLPAAHAVLPTQADIERLKAAGDQ